MSTKKEPKYQILLTELDRYAWHANVADLTVKPPAATAITAKSLGELLAKVLIAVSLRDKNLGVPEGAVQGALNPAYNGEASPSSEPSPVILTPTRRLITPENP